MLRGLGSQLFSAISEQHIGPAFKGHLAQEDCWTLQGGTDTLSRNAGNQPPASAMQHPNSGSLKSDTAVAIGCYLDSFVCADGND
jgi:hypothetical protein